MDCSTLELEWSCDECNSRYRLFDDMHAAVAALTRHVEVRAELGKASIAAVAEEQLQEVLLGLKVKAEVMHKKSNKYVGHLMRDANVTMYVQKQKARLEEPATYVTADYMMKKEYGTARAKTNEHFTKQSFSNLGVQFEILHSATETTETVETETTSDSGEQGKQRQVSFINMICSDTDQDWFKAAHDVFAAMRKFKEQNPHITKAVLLTDGAANFTCAGFLLLMANSEYYTGIEITEFLHNEGGEGKTRVDSNFAHIKRHLASFALTHNTDDVDKVTIGLNSNGGVVGNISFVCPINRDNVPELQKASGKGVLSGRHAVLSNAFESDAEGHRWIVMRDNPGIGSGRRVSVDALKDALTLNNGSNSSRLQDFLAAGFLSAEPYIPHDVDGGKTEISSIVESSDGPAARKKRCKRPVSPAKYNPWQGRVTYACSQGCGRHFLSYGSCLYHSEDCRGKDHVFEVVSGTDADARATAAHTEILVGPAVADTVECTVSYKPAEPLQQGFALRPPKEKAKFFSSRAIELLTQLYWEGSRAAQQQKGTVAKARLRCTGVRAADCLLADTRCDTEKPTLADDSAAYRTQLASRCKAWFVRFHSKVTKGEIRVATAEVVTEFQAREIEVTLEALLAVDCDHRRQQHDPVGDNRCHGCGRGSAWHKSAMFLCTSCAVLVCEDCHSVLNARQARSEDCNARFIAAVARGFLARREARRQMDGARATLQMQTNDIQTTADSEPELELPCSESTAAADMPTAAAARTDGQMHPPQLAVQPSRQSAREKRPSVRLSGYETSFRFNLTGS